jgi:hypothetical protein
MRFGRAKRLCAATILAVVLVPLALAGTAAAAGPRLFGQVARDGTLMDIGWSEGLLGAYTSFMEGGVLREDAIYVTIYAPNIVANETRVLNFTTYSMRQVQVLLANNTTETVTQRYDIVTWEAGFNVEPRKVLSTLYPIPTAPEERWLTVRYWDIEFTIIHHTAPALWPLGELTRGGQLAYFLSVMLLASLTWGAGTATARAAIRRAKFFPPVSGAGWGFLFLGSMFIFGGVGLFYYYDIAGIEWWWWVVPFYLVSFVAMLGVLPHPTERWHLARFVSATKETLDVELREHVVTGDRERGWLLIHSTSRWQFVLRLLGARTPVVWAPGPAPWSARNLLYEAPPDINRLYLLDPAAVPKIEYPRVGWKPWSPMGAQLHRPGILDGRAEVPLSGAYMQPVASAVLSQIIAVAAVAKDRDVLQLKVADLEARVEAGAVVQDRRQLDIILASTAVLTGRRKEEEAKAHIEAVKAEVMKEKEKSEEAALNA